MSPPCVHKFFNNKGCNREDCPYLHYKPYNMPIGKWIYAINQQKNKLDKYKFCDDLNNEFTKMCTNFNCKIPFCTFAHSEIERNEKLKSIGVLEMNTCIPIFPNMSGKRSYTSRSPPRRRRYRSRSPPRRRRYRSRSRSPSPRRRRIKRRRSRSRSRSRSRERNINISKTDIEAEINIRVQQELKKQKVQQQVQNQVQQQVQQQIKLQMQQIQHLHQINPHNNSYFQGQIPSTPNMNYYSNYIPSSATQANAQQNTTNIVDSYYS